MGTLNKTIMGAFSGTVGNVVGSSWRGIPYMKSKYKKRTKNISAQEKANRQKFKVAQRWLTYLIFYVRQGYKGYSSTVEGYVAAKSYLLKNAMEFTGGQWTVNPALMKVSVGSLPVSENIVVTPSDKGILQFTWEPGNAEGERSDDQVMLLAYDIKNEVAVSTTTGAFRKTGAESLTTHCKNGDSCHVWIAFVAHDRSRQSDSVYLGEIGF